MATFYFFLNLFLWCAAFGAGLVIAKRPRRQWLPVAVVAGSLVALLGLISTRAEWEFLLMLWPDYVFVRESKCIVLGLFLIAIGIRELQSRADKAELPAERAVLKTRARLLILLVTVLIGYLGYSFHWMIYHTHYTKEELPTHWDENRICLQTTGWTCVAASLTTVSDRLGIKTSQAEMARLSLVRPGGGTTDLHSIRAMQMKFGDAYQVDIRRLGYDQLLQTPLPALSSTLFTFPLYHSIAILEVSPQAITIADPLYGKKVMPRDEFAAQWTGIVITAVPKKR